MFKRGFFIALLSLIVLSASFFTGYFTMQRYANNSNTKNPVNSSGLSLNGTASAQDNNGSYEILINENTKIVKQQVYTRGVAFKTGYDTYETDGTASRDIIGFNLEQTSSYYKKDGYIVSKFTADEVVLQKEIKDSYPPNRFVLKDDSGTVKLYSTGKDGKLVFVENSDVDLSTQSEDIKQEVGKGIIFANKDEVYGYLDDINS